VVIALANPIAIVDDFHPHPKAWRRHALSLPFDHYGNFPGKRTQATFDDDLVRRMEHAIGRRITDWPTEKSNASFQLTDHEDTTWVHADDYISAVLFLTPDAPLLTGTSFYRHLATGLHRYPGPRADGGVDVFNRDGPHFDRWQEVDRVGNIFNRMVIFPGNLFHAATGYFGSPESPPEQRLTQVFFFSVSG
jgi:hypothetical protein